MGPGARLRRRASNGFDLVAGSVAVKAANLPGRLLLYRSNGCFAEVQQAGQPSVVFHAISAGPRMEIEVREGQMLAHATGASQGQLNFVKLGPKERALVAPRERPDKHHVDDEDAASYLTPVLTVTIPQEHSAAATVARGSTSGRWTFRQLPGATWGENELMLVVETGADERVVPLGGPGNDDPAASAEDPFQFDVQLSNHGLTPGVHQVRVRYVSYAAGSDGNKWLGTVESAPVEVTVGE